MGVCCNASKETETQNIVIEKSKSFDPSKEIEASPSTTLEVIEKENH